MNQVMFLKNEIIQNATDDGNNRVGGNGGNGKGGGGSKTVNRFEGSTPLALEDLEFINEIEKISSRIEDRSPSKTSSPNSFTNPSSPSKKSSSSNTFLQRLSGNSSTSSEASRNGMQRSPERTRLPLGIEGIEHYSTGSNRKNGRRGLCANNTNLSNSKLSLGIEDLDLYRSSNGYFGKTVVTTPSAVSVLYGDRSHHSTETTMRERIRNIDRNNSNTKMLSSGTRVTGGFEKMQSLNQEYQNLVEIAQDAIVEEAVHEARSTLRSKLRERVLEISHHHSPRGSATTTTTTTTPDNSFSFSSPGASSYNYVPSVQEVNKRGGPTSPLATTRTFSTLSQQWSPLPNPSERFDKPEEYGRDSLNFRHAEDPMNVNNYGGMSSLQKRHGL